MGTKVTVLGLGAMGATLAGAFTAAGHRTTVWNRTAGRAAALMERGAVEAPSAAQAVAASPLVVICVSAYDAVHDVVGPLAAGLTGSTLVNLTSGSPPQARETAAWAERHGIAYLEGALMSTPSGIGDPDFLQLYSGPRAAFDKHRETLAALGHPVHLGTDPALPSVYDSALLGLLWSTLTGWLHGVALIGAEGPGGGVTATEFTDVVNHWMKSVGAFMNTYAPQIDAGRYPGGEFPLTLHLSMMDLLAHASELRGVEPGLPDLLRELTGRAVAAGHGDDSYARLVEFVRKSGKH
ncbi:NAD(P)-dependent oxidoreductase [Streptomyces hesseae]|uniref:NAD(P)-binding domain-containing protein n=1 Tax=Streptomyces hesseae TaxID=3075519 RepID=A0ABU2SF41_9ACTN|nr:NAD(P)-binding domain-containing protein [Streptomyces sp. DSM 40473]MDT0447565.1 NAD(P)-binding domain-containing protein [Streptomyces sp. DSM 40473]